MFHQIMNYRSRLFLRCDSSNVRLNFIYYYWLWWLLIVNVWMSFIYLPSAAPLELNSIWLSLFAEDINDTSNYLEPFRSLFIILPSILVDLISPFCLSRAPVPSTTTIVGRSCSIAQIFSLALAQFCFWDENEKKFLITSLIVYETKVKWTWDG